MRVLGIDPSSSAPGLALFENGEPIWCKTYHLKGKSIITRVGNFLPLFLNKVLDKNIDYVAIETPYLGVSKSTSMKMGTIYGMFVGALFTLGFVPDENLFEIHPMTAKAAVGASSFKNRDEGKTTVYQVMTEKYPRLEIEDDNSSDALAIAIAAIKEINDRTDTN